MSLLKFQSTNPNFTWLVEKRPSSGPQPRKNRRGHMLGWFPYNHPQEYAVWFKDSQYESSYNYYIQDQPPSDATRFNSVLFVLDAFSTYFRNLWLHGNEQDTPDRYEHWICVNQILLRQDKYIKIFEAALSKDFKIEATELCPKNYRVVFSTKKSARDLLAFTGLFCLFNVLKNNNETYEFNDDSVVKFANIAAQFNAPYFIRYVFKCNLLREQKRFERFKGLLEKEGIELEYGTTSQQRQLKLKEHFVQDLNVVDFGCGEGQNVSFFAKRMQAGRFYYAIDREEDARNQVARSSKRKNLKQVVVLESLPEMSNPYQVFLTEVIEHNEPEASLKIVQMFLEDPNCWQILATTPNKDFNVHYHMDDDETRHVDHVFEFTETEFKAWLDELKLVMPRNWQVFASDVGDKVEGIKPTFFLKLIRADVSFDNIPKNAAAAEEEVSDAE